MDEGDVLISLKVPRDTVNVELFIKMTKGHFGYTDGPLELIQLEEVLEPVTHPQQNYQREDPAP